MGRNYVLLQSFQLLHLHTAATIISTSSYWQTTIAATKHFFLSLGIAPNKGFLQNTSNTLNSADNIPSPPISLLPCPSHPTNPLSPSFLFSPSREKCPR